MASDNEASCESDPNFAVICAFLDKFGITCGLPTIDFLELQEMLENTQEVPQELIDLHIKLLRKSRKTVSIERWEKAIIKFCHTFCVQDAWEIERFGYKKARISSKLRVLKELLELQFDYNVRFKSEINKMSAVELRSEPLGKDKHGHLYWYQFDNNCQIRIYKEDPDEETWTLVAKDRDGWANLINDLSDGDSKISSESTNNEEDSNSLAEKPIIDTGQGDSSSSDQIKDEKADIDVVKKADISQIDEENPETDNEQSSDDEEDESGKKRAIESDNEGRSSKKPKPEVEVSEAIEEPLMLVKGEGTGAENTSPVENPIVGDTIEEDVVYFYGAGDGASCQTGNENEKSETAANTHSAADEMKTDASEKCASDDSISGNSLSGVKHPYKLGTIIDTKTDNNKFLNKNDKSPTKKSSRWDVESMLATETKPTGGRVKELVNKWEQQQSETPSVEVTPSKKPMFFFGPGCLQFKTVATPATSTATVGFGQKVPQNSSVNEKSADHTDKSTNDDQEIILSKTKGDIGYRIETESESDKPLGSEALASLESEVIQSIDQPDRSSAATAKIPEVTAALVEAESKSTNIVDKVIESIDKGVKISNPPIAQDNLKEDVVDNVENGPELVPIVEEVCVKKNAYTLGPSDCIKSPQNVDTETVITESKDDSTNQQLENKIFVEKEIEREELPNDNINDIKLCESKEDDSKSSVNLLEKPNENLETGNKSDRETININCNESNQDITLGTNNESDKKDTQSVCYDESKANKKEENLDEKIPVQSESTETEIVSGKSSEIVKEDNKKPKEDLSDIKDNSEENQQNDTKTTGKSENEDVEISTSEISTDLSAEQKSNKAKEEEKNDEIIQPVVEKEIEKCLEKNVTKPEQKIETKSEHHYKGFSVNELLKIDDSKNETVSINIENNASPVITKPNSFSNYKEESVDKNLPEKTEIYSKSSEDLVIEHKSYQEECYEGTSNENLTTENKFESKPIEVLLDSSVKNESSDKEANQECFKLNVPEQSEIVSTFLDKLEKFHKEETCQDSSNLLVKPEIDSKPIEIPLVSSVKHENVDKDSSNLNVPVQSEILSTSLDKQDKSYKEESYQVASNSSTDMKTEVQSKSVALIETKFCKKEKDLDSSNLKNIEVDPETESKSSKISKAFLDNPEESTQSESTYVVDKVETESEDKPENLSKPSITNTVYENHEKNVVKIDEVEQKSETVEKVEETEVATLNEDNKTVELPKELDKIPDIHKEQVAALDIDNKKVVLPEELKEKPEICKDPAIVIENESKIVQENSSAIETPKELQKDEVLSPVIDPKENIITEKTISSVEAIENLNEIKNLEVPPVLTVQHTATEQVDLPEKKIETKTQGDTPPVLTIEKPEEKLSTKSELEVEPPILEIAKTTPLTNDIEINKLVEDPINSDDTTQQNKRGRFSAVSVATENDNKKIKLSSDVELIEEDPLGQIEKFVPSPPDSEGSVSMAEPLMEADDDDSHDVMELPEADPLAVSENEAKAAEEEEENEAKPAKMSLSTFSLDFTDPPPSPPRRALRKRGHDTTPIEEVESGKRIKMKGKRSVDVALRKSIEEQKKQELISSDDDNNKTEQQADDENDEDKEIATPVAPVKKSSKKKGKKKEKKSGDGGTTTPKKPTNPANKNKRLLTSLGINPDQPLEVDTGVVGVRQSRRIAQLKIKEEAERRKLEEETAQELLIMQKKKKSKKSEDKDYKSSEKKKVKQADDVDEEEDDSNDSKKRKKKKKKNRKLFDEYNPWRSSSDSSSNDEEEIGEEEEEEDEELHLQYVSDHEFSPESDLEGDGEAQPLKRARTARKAELFPESADVEEEVDDCPCQKCSKSDHPEWILLCDRCDNGWHCSCLRPPLLVIPEGDWYCPPCQHVRLLQNLQEKLKDYDRLLSKKLLEDRRKERLAYVGISLNNVLPSNESAKKKKRSVVDDDDAEQDDDEDDDEEDDDGGDEVTMGNDDEDDESSSEEESGSRTPSESGSDSDEPIYQLRQRRQAHSYRFNDYDELINSAIQDEMEAVGAGNQGRGKDIATIVNAEGEPRVEAPEAPEPLPPVLSQPVEEEERPVYSDDEPIHKVKKKLVGRKKHRKLNSLDISSEDSGSDEDFKGTSSDSDDDFDDDLGSEDSEFDTGRGRRRGHDPVRRSTRARTSRYDADFIDDGDTEEEDEPPSRKKKRSIWDESESESESDRSWGRRKRKPASRQKRTPAATAAATIKKKKTKKKKKSNEDSDAEVYRKKKPKIKFGIDGDGLEAGSGRRTRGKKINYVDALGSDSDEDRVKRPPPRIESEEEYVANEDEELDEDEKVSEEEEDAETNQSKKTPEIHIQSFADSKFTQPLPEGVPTPKHLYTNQNQTEPEEELNPIAQINKNLEEMDENEMEKMMEEEEYANKQLQLVALQIEKEKKRKEREAKKMEVTVTPPPTSVIQSAIVEDLGPKKRGRKPKNQFQFGPEPIVTNVDSMMLTTENNDELSEPPGVTLPSFADFDDSEEEKKRRGRNKKSLEEAVANLGRQQDPSPFMGSIPPSTKHPAELSGQESNIEIAAPPQPFSQSHPTPSVITRMLQNKPGQPGYPVGTIRPKQFAAMSEREEEGIGGHLPPGPGPYLSPGAGLRPQLGSPYRQMPPNMNHYPRGAAPPQIRNPAPHIYHSHRPMDPSPSGGGLTEHSSPGRVVSPASSSPGSNKNETPPPPYARPPVVTRFPMGGAAAGPRHLHMIASHLQPPRPSMSPYHPNLPPYHYGQFAPQPLSGAAEDAMPPTVYQSSPYSEQFPHEPGQVNPGDNSNSKSFDEESGGEFGGLVSYFSSQREDDLES